MIAYKLNQDGSLSNKAVLNNANELYEWISKYNFASVRVESETTGIIQNYTDTGDGVYKLMEVTQ